VRSQSHINYRTFIEILVTAVFLSFPLLFYFFYSKFKPSEVVLPGIYYLGVYFYEALFLIILNLIWFWRYLSHKSENEYRKTTIGTIICISIIIMFTVSIVFLLILTEMTSGFYAHFYQQLRDLYDTIQSLIVTNSNYNDMLGNLSDLIGRKFRDIIIAYDNTTAFYIYETFYKNQRLAGILGILYGLFSVIPYRVGVLLGAEAESENDVARTLLNIVSIFSIVIVLMIFAARQPGYLGFIKHTVAFSPILLAIFFISLGYVLGSRSVGHRGYRNFIIVAGVLFCFVIGLILGSLSIPFTRIPVKIGIRTITSDLQIIDFTFSTGYYFIYPSIYPFITVLLLTISNIVMIVYSDPDHYLSRFIKEFILGD